jgi:hypothetical protein
MIMSISRTVFAAALAVAPVGLLAGCESTAVAVQHKEASLTALGFLARPADTPARQAMLKKLPPFKFLRRTRGSDVRYIYADPLDCTCLYVGSAKAYAQYRELQRLRVAVKEIRADAFADQMAAADYDAPCWDWGAWGSFGEEFPYDGGPGW